MEASVVQQLAAQVVPQGEGEAHWWVGQLATIKVTAEETGGAFTLVEIEVGPGFSTPLHIHHNEDEGFWMLDGSATFEVGDLVIEASVGDYLFGPRDIKHRWTAGPDGARMLYLFTPGGFEGLIREMGVPAESRTVPVEPYIPEDIAEIGLRHGTELLPG